MKGSVEYRDLRNIWQQFHGGTNPAEVSWVMQGRQWCIGLDTCKHFIVDQAWPGKLLAAVNDAMAHRADRLIEVRVE